MMRKNCPHCEKPIHVCPNCHKPFAQPDKFFECVVCKIYYCFVCIYECCDMFFCWKHYTQHYEDRDDDHLNEEEHEAECNCDECAMQQNAIDRHDWTTGEWD